MNTAREACPDGKEYLSGPIKNKLLSELGRLLLIIAFSMQTIKMSISNPEKIVIKTSVGFFSVYIYLMSITYE